MHEANLCENSLSPNFRISTDFYEKFDSGLGIQESHCLDAAGPAQATTPGPHPLDNIHYLIYNI